jgi:hypothetical protein
VPVATRLRLLGCGLLAALAASGCGGGEDDATGSGRPAGTGSGRAVMDRASADAASGPGLQGRRCQGQVGGFIGSMDALRRRLVVGLAYEQYVQEVEGVRAAYERIPTDELAIACLTGVGTPGEKGFNVYIDAGNEWGECVGEAGYESTTVEPVLQRKWRLASRYLSEAHRGLRELGAG